MDKNIDNELTPKERLEELEERAFQVLPHYCMYNDKREVIELIDWSAADKLEWSYEEFIGELNLVLDNVTDDREIEKYLKRRERELERIANDIHLVVDVTNFPEPDWLVEGFIVRNGLTLLYGDSGTGKTSLCLYLADAMQKGGDLFGLKCREGKVIFVENDESGELLRSHKDKVGLPENLSVANTDIVWDNNKKFNKEFEDLLYYYIPDVVVLDAYSSLGIPDITRPESALVLDELRRLAEKHHCAMVIIHHTNLRGEQMGSNLHRAKMDSMVSLAQVGDDKIVLTQEKIRGSKFEAKVIDFNRDTLKMKEGTTSVKTLVLDLHGQGYLEEEIQGMMPKVRKDTIKRYIREAKKAQSSS